MADDAALRELLRAVVDEAVRETINRHKRRQKRRARVRRFHVAVGNSGKVVLADIVLAPRP